MLSRDESSKRRVHLVSERDEAVSTDCRPFVDIDTEAPECGMSMPEDMEDSFSIVNGCWDAISTVSGADHPPWY